jgi:two-component system cell cycle sensor histidine kinase/response regulator CckA
LNLVVNARDAMPTGGKLIIETSNVSLDESFAQQRAYPIKLGDYALITVTDTGIGMNADIEAHIFEPFFTTKEKGKGTGLGLATVYGIVKQSGGYIEVSSKPSLGTRFRIYLPLVNDEPVARMRPSEQTTVAKPNCTILVVEDEESLLKSTCCLLRSLGYKVVSANSGDAALRIVEQMRGDINLVLADVVMPGMGGLELVEKLLATWNGFGVIFMSGYTGQSAGRNSEFSPNSLFLLKPFTKDDLAQKVNEVLHTQTPLAASC